MPNVLKQFGPPVVALAMMGSLLAFGRLNIVTHGVDDFMSRSKKAIDDLPMKLGPWEAKRTDLDAKARDLLKPNAEASLLYTAQLGSQIFQAHYSVIQVADSR